MKEAAVRLKGNGSADAQFEAARDMLRAGGIGGVGMVYRLMTSLPARHFRLGRRGRVKEGYAADLVLFDPANAGDATFDKPHAYAAGFLYVLVNGVPVVDRGDPTGAKPGQIVTPAQ